jgi:Phytanoyl-CoA dioxygenase (PhyH)
MVTRTAAEPVAKSSLETVGYDILKGFLRADEADTVRALVDSTLESPHGMSCARPNNTLVSLRWSDPIVRTLLDSEGRMNQLCKAASADDLRWISGYISVKEPHSPALWWHSDWWCWDHPLSFRRDAAQVAVLTYLDDTSPENGALRLLPRSHHKSAPIHALLPEAHSKSAEELKPDDAAMKDLTDEVTLALNPGDAAVIDYRLLHGTHPNSSAHRRDCVLLSFTPSWRRLPDDLKSHLIQHPALPSESERSEMSSTTAQFLPQYDGPPASLELNRNAPPQFEIGD